LADLNGEQQVSETLNLHQVPEAMTLHRALWAGRIMSAFVVIVLVADGTIQLFAPAQIASMLRETGFAMDLTRVVGPIVLACAILYAIPATAVLGAILVTGFLGGAICAHVRIGELGSPPEIISLLLGVMTWGGLCARDPRIRAILPLIR
jgi:DoxX-like family